MSPHDVIISSPSQISSLSGGENLTQIRLDTFCPGELLVNSPGQLSSSHSKEDQMSTIASQHQHHKEPAQPLMSPLLSPQVPLLSIPTLLYSTLRQDSLPLSPNLGRDQLAPLSPTESPLPSLQEKEEEAVAGPSNSSQESWSPDSDQAKQGRKEYYFSVILSGCFHHFVKTVLYQRVVQVKETNTL